jgi:BolA protein
METEQLIREKLIEAFHPDFLEISNHSKAHANHAGSPKTEASHLHIKMKSALFKDKSKIECHRMVYKVLEQELKADVHALQLDLRSS